MGRPATDKKDRLVDAASTRFHRHGVAASPLATVAADAGIPPGNVFYYFRTKDSLASAVIDRWCGRVRDVLDDVESIDDPLERIGTFVAGADARRQDYADFGCPLVALRSDLRLAGPSLAASAGQPISLLRAWFSAQFELGGLVEVEARKEADFFLAALQGSYSLAHATGDPAVVSATVDRLLGRIAAMRA